MKVTVKDTAKCQKTLHIEVSPQAISEEFERVYKEIQKNAQVPGFRKGKAPRNILEQQFAAKAEENVMSNLVGESYYKAIEKEKIKPVTMPQISNVDFKKKDKLTFQAVVDVSPVFNLKDYKGIKINKTILNVTDADVEKILSFLQERYAQFSPAQERETRLGDYIICDYSYIVEDKVIDKREHVWMAITEEMFIAGLSHELIGIGPQTEKKFTLNLPKDFHPAELAKKKADFRFLIKEIKEKKLPEANDDLAKMIGKETLAELKKQIQEDLLKEKEMNIAQEMKNQVIEHLVKAMPIEVPETLIEEREKFLRESAKKRLKQQGVDDAQIAEEEKRMDDFFKKEALKQIRLFFILESIGHKENITVSREDVEARLELIAKMHNQKKEDVLRYMQEKKILENLQAEIWEEKIFSFLTENAAVSEVSKIPEKQGEAK